MRVLHAFFVESKVNVTLDQATVEKINKANAAPGVVKLRKVLTMFKKKDPNYAITRMNAMNAVNDLNLLVGREFEKGRKPTDAELSKWVVAALDDHRLFDEFADAFLAYIKAVVAAL